MTLDLPDGAHVQIYVLTSPPMAMTEIVPSVPVASPSIQPRRRVGRTMLKGAAGLALLVLAFSVGQHSGASPARLEIARYIPPARPPAALATAPLEQRAFPDRPLPQALAQGGDNRVPPAFQRQIQQPPTVVPPPGQPATPGNANPFGLEN